MGQVNENDNNKNRKYKTMDEADCGTLMQKILKQRIGTNSTDPYVKAIRWALDRIGEEGIVAFVTNNSFLDGVAFDGMRKHLADDWHSIYILGLRWKCTERV